MSGPVEFRTRDRWPEYRSALRDLLEDLGGGRGRDRTPAAEPADVPDPVAESAAACGVRARYGRLGQRTPERAWPSVLAVEADTGSPVALTSGREPTCPAQADPVLARHGWRLYRRLPAQLPWGWALLRFATRDAPARARAAAWCGTVAAGLLASVIPLETAGPSTAPMVAVAAVVGMVVALAVRDRGATEVLNHAQALMEPAVWDRLLDVRASRHRRDGSGGPVEAALAVVQLRGLVAPAVLDALLAAALLCSALAILVCVALWLCVADVAVIVLAGFALRGLARRRRPRERVAARHAEAASALLYRALAAIDEIHANRQGRALVNRWSTMLERQHRAQTAAVRSEEYAAGVAGMLPLLLFTTVAASVPMLRLGPSATLVAGFASLQLALAVGRVDQTARTVLMTGAAVCERLQNGLQEAPGAPDPTAHPGRIAGAITLSGVSVCHPGSPVPALRDITLRIGAGELLAVTGPSGAGASSLLRVLAGVIVPDTGVAVYDTASAGAAYPDLVRDQIGFVPQDVWTPLGTVRSVIAGVDDPALDSQVWRAAEAAGIAEGLRRLPMRLATVMSDAGGGFSVGQLSQLMLARALATNPRVLLLDDIGGAFDDATHRRVHELAITRVVVTRRLDVLRTADRVVFLRDGRIAESGSYDELIARDGALVRFLTVPGTSDTATKPRPLPGNGETCAQ